jgi:cytochrome c556
MKRLTYGAALLVPALLGVTAGAEGERKLSIMAVMHKQYTVSRAPFVLIKKELDSEAPDWEKIHEQTRKFASLAGALEKNEARWGDKESWKRFISLHSADARAMDDAAEAREKNSLLVIHRRLATSCKACHNAHRYRGRD